VAAITVNNLSQLLPLSTVAEVLGISVYSVRRHVAAGRINAVRVGSRVLVSDKEVARIQTTGTRTSRRGMRKVSRG
jgi:excisionase family DNA binding protein